DEIKAKIKNAQSAISKKKTRLSVDEQVNLSRLKKNKFLALRLNALAVKHHIRSRLCQRKFELEQLHNSYRPSINQAKLDKHAQQQIKRKEPGIQTLARNYNKLCAEMEALIKAKRNYNKLCAEMEALIKAKRSPKGALAPSKIDTDKLFNLDVDDPIWQDTGLTDQTDDLDSVPAWLGNEAVIGGIKALLEHDRCKEEERRLIEEKVSLQQWFKEEWDITLVASYWLTKKEDMLYQMELRRKYLLRLYLHWEPPLQVIPNKSNDCISWGPSQEDIEAARHYENNEQVDYEQAENDIRQMVVDNEREDTLSDDNEGMAVLSDDEELDENEMDDA
ncbi:hypothetical protein CVT26_011724, partial [Gymnopilus dilepis]